MLDELDENGMDFSRAELPFSKIKVIPCWENFHVRPGHVTGVEWIR